MLAPGGDDEEVDRNGHRGHAIDLVNGVFQGSLVEYYGATDVEKGDNTRWEDDIDLMTPEAHWVPLDDSNEMIPNINGNAGPIDRFYYHPFDIYKIRRLVKSPGKANKP